MKIINFLSKKMKMFKFFFQVFVHAKVFFSIGGQHFNGEPVHFAYMPDTVMEHARDVTIKLHHRIGRYLQVHLYFALRWIMLSEISFISGKHTIIFLILHIYKKKFRKVSCAYTHNNWCK